MSETAKRYITIGLFVYLIELAVIVLAEYMGAEALVAVGLSFWVGLAVSFFLQKFITFKDKRTHYKVMLPQFIAVCTLVLFNFGFTLLCTKLLSSSLPVFIIRAGAIGMTSIWNFYLYRTKIYQRSDILPID